MRIELTQEQATFLLKILSKERNDIADELYAEVSHVYDACGEAKQFIEENCEYTLSENQENFVIDAFVADHEISFDYSGRGMFGRKCPSVTLSPRETFSTSSHFSQDSMGLDKVIYAES